MNVWMDIGIAALIVLFAYSGYKRGLIYMVISTVGTIASMIAAAMLSGLLGGVIYNSFIRSNVINGLSQATSGIAVSDPAVAAEAVIQNVSNFTRNTFALIGIDQNSLSVSIKDSVIGIPETIEELIRPYAVKTVSSILTVLLFLVLMVIVAFVGKKLSKTVNKTVLGVPNRIFGALIGIAEAILIAMVLGLIIYFIAMFISPESCASLKESINNTIFCRMISAINLPDLIISWLSAV